tara:strand:- start:138 stop:584 length:447 start_codon:yes stop_codon:yes gene_type:complete
MWLGVLNVEEINGKFFATEGLPCAPLTLMGTLLQTLFLTCPSRASVFASCHVGGAEGVSVLAQSEACECPTYLPDHGETGVRSKPADPAAVGKRDSKDNMSRFTVISVFLVFIFSFTGCISQVSGNGCSCQSVLTVWLFGRLGYVMLF